jgi:hypothetical protein
MVSPYTKRNERKESRAGERLTTASAFHTIKVPSKFSCPHAIAAFLVLNEGPLSAFVEYPTSHLKAILVSCI